ncbi:MAG TPA: glycoside hydrolase family 15 protein [Planctomycetaceae bacterium]|nr:glycoside hydrolase family 15 protein [Planctomycetaceae bacterium]
MAVIIHNSNLEVYLQRDWSRESLDQLESLLISRGTFEFPSLPNGLFPAAVAEGYTGYGNVWVRDNVHLAHHFHVLGETHCAAGIVRGLTQFLMTQTSKIEQVIAGELTHDDPMNRPHVRFEGGSLTELDEKWSHAQNDALGYYLWIACELLLAREIEFARAEIDLLLLFPALFRHFRFWQDKDSGHWEETRKVSASSIGTAIRGLQSLVKLLADRADLPGMNSVRRASLFPEIEDLISHGMQTLSKTLPWECRSDDPLERRQYDGALLFLIYPLGLLDPNSGQAEKIVSDVRKHLQGEIGIRRYPGDSYWCADYKEKLPEETRTADFSDDLSLRDSLLKPGEEAQWCIFDPIISVIYGQRFLASGQPADRELQIEYFNRSIGQISGAGGEWPEFRCPESYFLSRGIWRPNDVTPLLWTQANLRLAFHQMRQTLDRSEVL